MYLYKGVGFYDVHVQPTKLSSSRPVFRTSSSLSPCLPQRQALRGKRAVHRVGKEDRGD